VPFELFANAASRPDVVFCDTSFLLDVLSHEVSLVSAALVGFDAPKQAKAASAAAFFNRYHDLGTQFVSSPFVFQELAFILYKAYPKRHGAKSWPALAKRDPAEVGRAYPKAVRLSGLAWERTRAHDIWFTLPEIGDETPYGRKSDAMVRTARLLKKKYEGLDWADAFHIATGAACGVEWFASTDGGWKDVVEINLFCYA
jgi:predicted nucleic acid-binding protein